MVKNLPPMQEAGFDPWVGKIPWRREWLPTPVFLPREFHGQRSLVGYCPWDHKESDTTEQLTVPPCFFFFFPTRRKWQPTPVLLSRKFHRWRSLMGYSPWGHEESDTTERLHDDGIAKCSTCLCAQLWLTFGNPMDDSLPCSSVHGISLARTLE